MSGCAAFQYSSRAMGREAHAVRKQEAAIQGSFMRAVEIGAPLRAAHESLRRALVEQAEPDWDGYGAMRASRAAAEHALRLMKLLPVGTRAPEVSVDPDGDIALEWCRDSRWVFSISVSSHGELNYAGLFGTNPIHGRESHFEDDLPFYVRVGVNRVNSRR